MEKQVSFTYAPSRWKGILFLSASSGLLIFLDVFLLSRFNLTQVSLQFFLMLIALVIFSVPLVFLLYRLYSLIFSFYRLERDGLHIQWGLRSEVIPLNAIQWIRSPMEMTEDVPWSVLPMPGAYLGTVPVGEHTTFEFLASDMSKMLFLGTSRYTYVISPEDPAAFLNGFERILQMGTLSTLEWTTSRPGNWILEAWRNKTGRICTLISLGLLIILYIWVGSRFQNNPGQDLAKGSISLIRIPMTATVIWLVGTALGLGIYQYKENRRAAELVWASVSAAILQCLIGAVMVFGFGW